MEMFLGEIPVVVLIQLLKSLSLLMFLVLNSDNNFFIAKILRVKFLNNYRSIMPTKPKSIANRHIYRAFLHFV